MSLAKNIARARKRAQLTQAELARRLNKSRSTVNEYEDEDGDHEPPIDVLRAIARITQTPLRDLVA